MPNNTIHSNEYYLTNNHIVFAGILALTPIGVLGLPDLLVKRYRQFKWHLAIFGIAIAVAAVISFSAIFFSFSGLENANETVSYIGGTTGCIIIFGSWLWSMWEGAWMLGNIETVRAQANQKGLL